MMIKLITSLTLFFWLCMQHANAADHVIHISVDGLYAPAINHLGEQLPNYSRLIREGASTLNARTDFDFTTTLPNHTSQFTGRQVTRNNGGHGWEINVDPGMDVTIHSNAGEYISSIFDVAHDAGLSTTLFTSKEKFLIFKRSWNQIHGAFDSSGTDYGKNKIDHYEFNDTTSQLVTSFINDLDNNNRHYSFLHLRDPDSAGHKFTWSLAPGSQYLTAVAVTDNYLGQILSFVESNGNYKNSTAVILTSDHGGLIGTFSHVINNYQSQTIPFFVWGENVTDIDLYALNQCTSTPPGQKALPDYSQQLQPVRNSDAANLALSLLNLPPIPGSSIRTIRHVSKKMVTTCAVDISMISLLLLQD